MNLNSWDFYDFEKEMQDASISDLLELYKREKKKHLDKCTEIVNSKGKLTEEGKKDFKKECEYIEGCKIKVALKIVDVLTK